MLIENISDTARWMAYVRALESARPDALFHAPFTAVLPERPEKPLRARSERRISLPAALRSVPLSWTN